MPKPLFRHDDAGHLLYSQHMLNVTVTFLVSNDQRLVCGHHGSSSFALHSVRSAIVKSRCCRACRAMFPRFLTSVFASSWFVTCPPNCTKSTRFVRHCFSTSRRRSTLSRPLDGVTRKMTTERDGDACTTEFACTARSKHDVATTVSTYTDRSSLCPLQLDPPRLYHSLELGKFLAGGSCSLSPIRMRTAFQTGDARRQRWNQDVIDDFS